MAKIKVVIKGVDTFMAFIPDVNGYEVDNEAYRAYEEARLAFDEAHEAMIESIDKESLK